MSRATFDAPTTLPSRTEVLPELEKLVARDPTFAPAWGYLSQLYIYIQVPLEATIWTRSAEETRRQWQPAFEKAERAGREAIRLDPRQAFAYANLALLESNRKHWSAAEDLLRQALEFDPYDPDVLRGEGIFLHQTGRVKESLRVFQQAQTLEPLAPDITSRLAIALMADNQANAAIAMLEARPLRQPNRNAVLAQAYAVTRRFDDAANTILLIGPGRFGDPQPVEVSARLIRGVPAKVSDPSALPALHGDLDFVYGYVGAPERLLDYPERAMQAGELAVPTLFAQNYAPARKTERFKALVRAYGLVDYWRVRGWPDLCRPMGTDDFVCD
jgi:tetratricopeptide (TPR) repeat protein